MSKTVRIILIILSVLSLANVLLAPMYDEGGGMLPSDTEYNFIKVIGVLFLEEGSLGLWVVHMTVGVFIPAVVMLASSITKIRWLFSIADTAGILVWAYNFFSYAAKHSFTEMLNIDKTDISIGSWIAILLFLISALVLLCSKKKKMEDKPEPKDGVCPHCGIELRNNSAICPRCGKSLKRDCKKSN